MKLFSTLNSHYNYEGSSGILWNYYIGAGWTNKRYTDYEFNENSKDWDAKPVNIGMPNFFFGMSLGFAF